MARQLHSRLKISGVLEAQTPLHVGGYGESFETDMALAKNGNDEFYIPGTSLTGTLRSWFRDNFDKEETNKIWGFQKEKDTSSNSVEQASFVLIEDMRLPEDLRNSLQSELRDGVGIDRHYGTAADKAKYDRAVLPKGTRLKFEMTIEIGENHDAGKVKAMFGYLLEALKKGEIRLGASKTRGYGRVKLDLEKIAENSLKGFENILQLLRKQSFETYSIQKLQEQNSIKPKTNEKINVTIKWKPKSPLMVKAGYDGIGVDTLPLISGIGNGQVSLCLPGTSVKGAFRAQAERIVRTFTGETAKGKKDFHEQIKLKFVNELFGAKKEKNDKSTLGLGALGVDDCYAELKMNADDWQKVEVGEFPNDETYSRAGLHQALKKIDGEANELPTNNFRIAHHTAVDRFTGAAADTALFSVLKPSPALVWEDLYLTVDLSRISEENKHCSLMLLLLVLRDFAENRLPLGFATNRGMGEVKDVSIEIKGAYSIRYQGGEFNFTDDSLKAEIQKEWNEWITKNQTSQN